MSFRGDNLTMQNIDSFVKGFREAYAFERHKPGTVQKDPGSHELNDLYLEYAKKRPGYTAKQIQETATFNFLDNLTQNTDNDSHLIGKVALLMTQYQMAKNLSQDAYDARGVARQLVMGGRKLSDDELLYFMKANYLPMISVSSIRDEGLKHVLGQTHYLIEQVISEAESVSLYVPRENSHAVPAYALLLPANVLKQLESGDDSRHRSSIPFTFANLKKLANGTLN